ncbi:MAG TPA: AAA family ATPase, partial [Actinomycetota bacterium]|nr:AAA family ATPase [Actinomycetota bacterium]
MKQTHRSTAAVLHGSDVFAKGRADVFRIRERTRRRRLLRAIILLGIFDAYLWYRYLTHNPFQLPALGPDWVIWLPLMLLILVFALVMLMPMFSGRSPHMIVRPEEIEVGLDEVQGLDAQVDEVTRTLDVFLGYATFRDELGGNPRRGILFEGPPGTGKTYLAKAMAKQAGVPFLFISAPAFQSMWFGMTGARIRSFFKALRKLARKEGGAIGFIEEIDAVGGDRGGMQASPDGTGLGRTRSSMVGPGGTGMVNELLIQMQSFDQPPYRARIRARLIEWVNSYLSPQHRIPATRPTYNNILLVAATNRADHLDQALLRPGRFDRRLYFDLPTKSDRRELIDFFLARKIHHAVLDDDNVRERLAHDTFGYTPVMLEHLFDEGLLVALRDGRKEMNVEDVHEAKLTEELGFKQSVTYTEADRVSVATHEAGHATVAYFVGKGRRLEVLSIIKRRQALGLLAHGDEEERFTRTRTEIEAGVAIALGGLAAEQIFLGETGTGPAADLQVATTLAAQMVGSFGMAGSLISFDAIAEGPIGSKNLVGKVLADPLGKERVEEILTAQRERVLALLEERREVVIALRDALIARDELVGREILEVIEV